VCVLTDWDKLIVDGAETTSIIVPGLAADEEYCVKMKSLSVIGDSHYTEPLKRRVFRAGNGVLRCFVLLYINCCLSSAYVVKLANYYEPICYYKGV